MELFMHNVADASCLADYPNVRVLALHLQTIPRALGLAQMQQLQRLSMTECSLESIRGLESCVQLLHLDVSMNRIQLMDRRVLSKLPCLRSLWMSENSISLIEGLEHLPKLHTLWLARNSIRFLYDSLDRCTGLTELNLAATEMDNLKEISNLSRLRSLSSLVLSDPRFGESPVCSLCNYETYVLSRLQQLQRLDTLVVSDEMRHLDQLRVLHLQGNDIWRLEGLEGLYRLRELVLDQNRIRQLEPESLSSLTSLRTLHLEENGLRSLAHLPPQLQTLALGTNRICDLAELERIDHLSETLTQITLANNPVTRKQHYRLALTQRLSELTLLDDREVTSEERARAQGLICADAPTPGGNDRQWLKVPLKITSMDFEMVSGLGTHVAAPPLTVAKPLGTNGGHGSLKWNLMTVGPAISVAPATSVGPATREDLLFPPHAKRFGGSQRRLEERANSQASLRESRTHGMNRTASIGRQ